MKKFVLISLYLFCTLFCGAAKVVIILGQSNSVGRAPMDSLQAEYETTFPLIQIWNQTTKKFEALNYLLNNNQWPVSEQSNEFGSEFAILTELQNYFGDTLYCIKYAVGGTRLGTDIGATVNWNASVRGSYYDACISVTNAALEFLWKNRHEINYDFYFFWEQGEGDSSLRINNSQNYQTNYTNLINGLRANLSGSMLTYSKKVWVCPRTNLLGISPIAAGVTITNATNANPIVITTSGAHGLTSGWNVGITGVIGNTAANDTLTVTVLSSNTFSIPTIGNGAYVSGGLVNKQIYTPTVNAAQNNVGSILTDVYSYPCESYSTFDGIHYTGTSYKNKGVTGANIIISNNL